MRRDNTENLNSSQKTVWYYPEATGAPDPRLEERYRYIKLLQSHMLIEDVYTQMLPTRGHSKNELFKVYLTPTSDSVASLVASALKPGVRGWRYELGPCVADFFLECAQSLMTFGEAIYEIVYFSNPEDHKVLAFELQKVRPLSVRRRRGQLVQVIPEEVVKRRGVSSFIHLPADRILILRLPAGLQRTVENTLESLAILSEKLMPEFVLHNFRQAGSKFHFDTASQLYSQKLALADAGKAIGWNARGLLQDEMLEFYRLRRQLSFELFKINLRAAILATLNEGLALAGMHMEFEAQIIIEGLPTISDVETAQSELDSGTKPFGEILKPFLFY